LCMHGKVALRPGDVRQGTQMNACTAVMG
jgi:hypothetical protein